MRAISGRVEAPRQVDRAAAMRAGGIAALLVLAVLLAARAGFYFWTTWAVIRWPHEIATGEATMLSESDRLGRNFLAGLRTLYGPQQPGRFVAGNYPPFYLTLWALKPGPAAFPTGRALSVLGGLAAAIGGGVAAYAVAGGSRRLRLGVAVLGAAAFICTVPVMQELAVAKPDMVALGCAAVGLAWFEARPGRRGTILAGVCFALGLLAKQSMGFGLAAACLAALRRGPRALLTLVVTVALVVGAVVGALWLIAGPTVFEHLLVYNLRQWHADENFHVLNRKLWEYHWPLLIPALGYGAWGVVKRPRSALSYYPFLTLATMLMVGSVGSYRYYFIPLCLAAGLGTALGLGALLEARPATALLPAAALLALLAFYTWRAYTYFTPANFNLNPPVDAGTLRNHLLAVVDATSEPILAEEVGYQAIRGRPLVLDDPYLAQILIHNGRWDDSAIIAGLREHRYTLVIVKPADDAVLRERWGDAFVDALYANYRETEPQVYRPK